jgi:erythromycin esterase-like protein
MGSAALLGLGCGLLGAQEPAPDAVEWLADHLIEFEGVEAGYGFEDLADLKDLVGSARIVALGECTHGSREIFQMKHRLVEYLASELGFSMVAIEAIMPEAVRVNDYVLRGHGEPRELCNTEELLGLLQWMRRFNSSGAGRLEYTGFDLRRADSAAQIVLDFIQQHDPQQLESFSEHYQRALSAERIPGPPFGVVTGSFPVAVAAGKTVRYSGFIQTRDVTLHARLWWQVDEDEEWLNFDQTSARWARGTTAWTPHELTLDVPADAEEIHFGVVLFGSGTAWFDELQIEIDGQPFQDASFDLGFESADLRGLRCYSPNYRAQLDRQNARGGSQCLQLAPRAALPTSGLSADQALPLAEVVLDHLRDHTAEYRNSEAKRVEWVLQNARLVVQYLQSNAGLVSRDQSMAANLRWICEQNPEARIIVWAHNVHVTREQGRMGSYMHRKYGEQYLPMAFATGRGAYFARGADGPVLQGLQQPVPGSIESFCAATDTPLFFLDLRQARLGSEESGWLAEERDYRALGVRAMEQQFRPIRLAESFDVLFYLDETHPARPLQPPD